MNYVLLQQRSRKVCLLIMTLFNPLYANRITLEIWLMTATCPPSEILYKALQEKGAQDALTFIIFVMHGLNLVFFFDLVSF